MRKRLRTNAGFTLIELIVVMVILVLLAALVTPRLVGRTEQGRRSATITQMAILENELQKYYIDTGDFPTSEDGLEALVREPSNVKRWKGPYLKDAILPQDAWGNEYEYESPGQDNRDYDLWAIGKDAQSGTDDDIKSWDPESKRE